MNNCLCQCLYYFMPWGAKREMEKERRGFAEWKEGWGSWKGNTASNQLLSRSFFEKASGYCYCCSVLQIRLLLERKDFNCSLRGAPQLL